MVRRSTMLTYNAIIEYCLDVASIAGIIIDVSCNIEHFAILLDALELQYIKKINIKDDSSNEEIILTIGKNAEFVVDSHELKINIDQIMLIKKMIFDVAIGNSFPGYHLDFEIPSENGTINVCIIIS